jgi:hypothetical protein
MQPMILGKMYQKTNATSREDRIAEGQAILDGVFATELELA